MPKIKTNRAAAKRYKKNAKGGLRHRCSNRSHILTKKAQKRKRHLRGMHAMSAADVNTAKRLLAVK
jgi:large subunit ribosomal protein L35